MVRNSLENECLSQLSPVSSVMVFVVHTTKTMMLMMTMLTAYDRDEKRCGWAGLYTNNRRFQEFGSHPKRSSTSQSVVTDSRGRK